ncbi:MAG: arylsulfatase [Verrucomicrobiota bacterium]
MTIKIEVNQFVIVIKRVIILLCVAFFQFQVVMAEKPNIVFIITDDQGYGDFGFTGNPLIQTPFLDKMAESCAQMTQFYVSPVCSPTRASLMTGRYHYRTGVTDTWKGRSMMKTEEVTLAEVLRDAGYATGLFGKWHLGDCYPMRPQDQGFEEVLMHKGGGIGQRSDPPGGEGKYTDPILFHNGKKVQEKGYCTDIYFDRAIEWISKQSKKGKPFFAYISTNAPHSPFHDVPLSWYDIYRKMDLRNKNVPQAGYPLQTNENNEQLDTRARIFAMISNIDENVGKIQPRLKELGILDNTMIIFMSDNGPDGNRYNSGFRGAKTEVYQGGVRTPFLIEWPAQFKKPVSSPRVAAHIDIMPTLLEACGVSYEGEFDGRSFLSLLSEDKIEWPDRYLFIQAHRGVRPTTYHHSAVITEEWKFVHPSGFHKEQFEGEPIFELYEISKDPYEQKNVAALYPEIVESMRGAYDTWLKEIDSSREGDYAMPSIHVGTKYENPMVLTGQDQQAARGDRGPYWKLEVAYGGKYDIECLFGPKKNIEEVVLSVQGKKLKKVVENGELIFKDIELVKGPADLSVILHAGEKHKSVWQVEIRYKPGA